MNKTLSQKEINKLADSLPAVERLTQERHIVSGEELIEQGHTEEAGSPVEAAKKYIQCLPVVMDINHKRNLKKIFRKHGDVGVIVYCNQINQVYNEKLARAN